MRNIYFSLLYSILGETFLDFHYLLGVLEILSVAVISGDMEDMETEPPVLQAHASPSAGLR
jgi:hypothetical protein